MMFGVLVFTLLGRWSTQGSLTSAAEMLVIVGFAAGVVGFSRFLARDEGRFLTDFLVQTVKGQRQKPDFATRVVQDR